MDWTDFEDAKGIPPFDHELGATNIVKMNERGCMSCLDLFTCFIDVKCLLKFVTTTNTLGSQQFVSKWKNLDVNELKTFITVILVSGLIPFSSRDYA